MCHQVCPAKSIWKGYAGCHTCTGSDAGCNCPLGQASACLLHVCTSAGGMFGVRPCCCLGVGAAGAPYSSAHHCTSPHLLMIHLTIYKTDWACGRLGPMGIVHFLAQFCQLRACALPCMQVWAQASKKCGEQRACSRLPRWCSKAACTTDRLSPFPHHFSLLLAESVLLADHASPIQSAPRPLQCLPPARLASAAQTAALLPPASAHKAMQAIRTSPPQTATSAPRATSMR